MRMIMVAMALLTMTAGAQTDPSFKAADTDNNGAVSKKEFKAYASRRLAGQNDAFFEKLFAAVDKDDDGLLTRAEFAKRMEALESVRGGGREGGRRRRPQVGKRDLKDKEGDFDKATRRAVPRDSFPVFDEPDMTAAADAKINDDEAVIGVVCDGEARAYPISVMGRHELGNDVCGRTPIAVSW